MKSKVKLSLADSMAQHIARLPTAEEKVDCVLRELGLLEEKRAKLQKVSEDQSKTINRLEVALKVKQDEIDGLQYNLERLKRRLNVLQEESKARVTFGHQSGSIFGELKSSLGFFKSSKAAPEPVDDTNELKERLADLIVQNGSFGYLRRAIKPRNSEVNKKQRGKRGS